jgi:hypothetical protein
MMPFASLELRRVAILHNFAFNTEMSHQQAKFLKILTVPADTAHLPQFAVGQPY